MRMAMPLLDIKNLNTYYGDLQALFDLSLQIEEGQVIALIGANAAGKSTLISAIAGLNAGKKGSIHFAGQAIEHMAAERIAHLGIALVPEGRLLFPSLSVEENLIMGSHTRRKGHWNLETVYQLFPILKEFRNRPSTSLS